MTRVGSRVGHFRILGALGRGGMGEVFEGFDETLQRRVALKTIRADRRLDESARGRFLREARMLSQLDHPAICRIHDYVEGDERDLLVLELIEGRTLRRVIKEGGIDFREKLRIAEEVGSALVAAHRLGIVHRDLKPDNVMLTADGNVKVLDFGLARAIVSPADQGVVEETAGAEDEAELSNDQQEEGETIIKRHAPAPILFPNETRAGDAVGTPGYMSPEQARGEIVTTASDIYSFGLVLQNLFSGRSPHHDSPLMLELAARGESLPVIGVDRDVAALITSMKSLAPSDRPTAQDVLERLARIGGRSRRLVQRLAAAAALLLVALATVKYISDVRHERNVAIQARADAERRRGQAEDLIGFMVGDLRTKLEGVGQLDVLDEVGAQALRYFKSLRPEEISPAELRRNAKTLSQLGEVRMSQGNLAGAEDVLQSSIVLATSAAEREPGEGKNQLELGASHFWMGTLRRQQGDLAGALDHYATYLRISEKLAASDPKNLDYQVEVGYGHSNVGTILEQQGELERALEHYQRAVAVKDRGSPTEAQRATWNGELAVTVNKIGVVLLSLGRYQEAQKALERERELLESVQRLEPKNPRWSHRLAVNCNYVASLFEEQGLHQEALAQYTAEREIETALVGHDPANAVWQRSLASSDLAIGRILASRDEIAAAEASLKKARARLEPLLKNDPNRAPWKRDYASIHESLASIMLRRGNLPAAVREIETATGALAGLEDGDVSARRTGWRIALTRGVIAEQAGDPVAARSEWSRVADALWPSRSTLQHVGDRDVLARALLHLNRIDDAAPLVESLVSQGYRKHALMKLWDAKRPARPSNRA